MHRSYKLILKQKLKKIRIQYHAHFDTVQHYSYDEISRHQTLIPVWCRKCDK